MLLCKPGPGLSCSTPSCVPVRPKPQVGTLRSGAILEFAVNSGQVGLQLKTRGAANCSTLCNSLRGLSGRRITHMQRINSWRATPVSSAVLAQRQSCHTCGTAAFSLTRRPSGAAALRPEVNSIRPLPDSQSRSRSRSRARRCVVLAYNGCRHISAGLVSVRSKLSPWPMLPWGEPGSQTGTRALERAHRALLFCYAFLRGRQSTRILHGSLGLILFCLRFLFFFRQRHHIGMRR